MSSKNKAQGAATPQAQALPGKGASFTHEPQDSAKAQESTPKPLKQATLFDAGDVRRPEDYFAEPTELERFHREKVAGLMLAHAQNHGGLFTFGDVLQASGYKQPKACRPNSVCGPGALLAQRRGWVEPVDKIRSERPQAHGAFGNIYRIGPMGGDDVAAIVGGSPCSDSGAAVAQGEEALA
ncbi:MAG: hypothetical protein EA402_05640 [Planctomycetota bacterium]|nr:MAG: hypothetical protein EA402_05640 [Planctomycetota bacterium]